MNQSTLEALLGRSLTSVEQTNLKLYLSIAYQRLSDLLCSNVEQDTGERVYEARDGYRTVFTDIFTGVSEVKVDGKTVTNYRPQQWDKRNAKWYNSIVFDSPVSGDVTVTADWGFVDCMPADLRLLVAQLFQLVGTMQTGNGNIKSKKIEDFSVTYGDTTVYDQFVADNAAVIGKYSQCEATNGGIEHGRLGNLSYC